MMEPWAWAIILPVIIGLIGVIYTAGQRRDDKQDVRMEKNEQAFDDKVKADAALHERVVRTETKVEINVDEIAKLRDMRHSILDDVTKTLAGWYSEIMDQIRKWK